MYQLPTVYSVHSLSVILTTTPYHMISFPFMERQRLRTGEFHKAWVLGAQPEGIWVWLTPRLALFLLLYPATFPQAFLENDDIAPPESLQAGEGSLIAINSFQASGLFPSPKGNSAHQLQEPQIDAFDSHSRRKVRQPPSQSSQGLHTSPEPTWCHGLYTQGSF